MQIQRTGYQQNFGTEFVATIHSPNVMRKLAILERRLVTKKAPECICVTCPPSKVYFADGEDVEMVFRRLNDGELSTPEQLDDFAATLEECMDVHAAEIEGDSLNELLEKVPMLKKFPFVQNILKGLFNLNAV